MLQIMPQNNKRRRVVKRSKVSKRNRFSYSIEQKNYAKEHGRNKTAAHFGLNKSMVGRWAKKNTSWTSELSRKSKSVGFGRKVFYPEIEKKAL